MWMLRVGDEVVVDIAQENIDWGYKPYPNGTKAKIVEFGEIGYGRTNNFGLEPGIYENTAWAFIEVDGKRSEGTISTCFLKVPDKVLKQRSKEKDFYKGRKLRDLPEMKFWEEDKVTLSAKGRKAYGGWRSEAEGETLTVKNVDYLRGGWRHYDVALPLGGQVGLKDEDLKLVERGNVWKYYHNEPMTFSSLREEAQLMLDMGFADEVRNPATGNFAWSMWNILSAVRSGVAHGFTQQGRLYPLPENHSMANVTVWKFRDEELGKKVAEATLFAADAVRREDR